jgi:hypothetical protein
MTLIPCQNKSERKIEHHSPCTTTKYIFTGVNSAGVTKIAIHVKYKKFDPKETLAFLKKKMREFLISPDTKIVRVLKITQSPKP